MRQSTEPIRVKLRLLRLRETSSHPKQSEVIPSPRKTTLPHPDGALSRKRHAKCGKALQFPVFMTVDAESKAMGDFV